MQVDIYNTGSKGNCSVIDDVIAIDAGWNCYPSCQVLLLTHAHSDHTKYINNFNGVPIMCLPETADALREKFPYTAFNVIEPYQEIALECNNNNNNNRYYIQILPVVHDVPCMGFVISKQVGSTFNRILYLTDFSRLAQETEHFVTQYLRDKLLDHVFIECNNTLLPGDMLDCYVNFEGSDSARPKDDYHRRRSLRNHCSASYLIDLFRNAGYAEDNSCSVPVTLLHKSQSYYGANPKLIDTLSRVANITNP